MLCVGQFHLANSKVVLQKSKLGWILAGKMNLPMYSHRTSSSSLNTSINLHVLENSNEELLQNQLEKFWHLEEKSTVKPVLSEEELYCEEHFRSTFKRDLSGRFVVTISFNDSLSQLGNSKQFALVIQN